jgi:hypothetical protein
MKSPLLLTLALAALLPTMAAVTVHAEETATPPAASQPKVVRGWELMTAEERAAHRAQMQAATPEERAKLRAEMHQKMAERAKAQGVTLPEHPGPQGFGRGGRCRS